jgi:hypothetical protein
MPNDQFSVQNKALIKKFQRCVLRNEKAYTFNPNQYEKIP